MINVCLNKLMEYANRECNAIMTIAKCTNTAASSNDSSHHSSTPAAWFASGTAYHGRRYQNLGSWTSLRSYTIVDSVSSFHNHVGGSSDLYSLILIAMLTFLLLFDVVLSIAIAEKALQAESGCDLL